MSDIFIGLDPGARGALAAIGADRSVYIAEFFPVVKIPKKPKRVKKKDKKHR